MNLVVDTELPPAARWALEELKRALRARGESVETAVSAGPDPGFVIGLAGGSPAVEDALSRSGVRCPGAPESLVLQPLAGEGFLICGSDERGLTYALLEAARAVELASPEADVFAAIPAAAESPHLAWRSMQLFLCNRRLEETWFYDDGFWEGYLGRLARCRYNNLSLTFGHQIAYLSPPYPFLLEVPGFPISRARRMGLRRFTGSCTFGGDGFEVMAPLTNKGVRADRPPWPVSADPALRSPAAEHGRHWMFCLLFGRLGYAPDASPEVWGGSCHHFGAAAASVEELYRTGGRILPLLTVVLQHSASLWTFWPERFAGRSLEEDAQVEPSDPTRFYGIDEYVEDALADRLCGKWTPPHVAHHLRRLADRVRCLLADLDREPAEAELRHTLLDFTLLTHLAEYHACRLLAAAHLAFFRQAGEACRLPAARQLLEEARGRWTALSSAAEENYCGDLVFGFREKGHAGHWKDDLSVIERDLGAVDALIAEQQEIPTAGPGPFPGGGAHPDPPEVSFDPPDRAAPGQDLVLQIRCESPRPRGVRCHYRITHQALDFGQVDMRCEGGGFQAVVPGEAIDPAWDLMLFFELFFEDGAGDPLAGLAHPHPLFRHPGGVRGWPEKQTWPETSMNARWRITFRSRMGARTASP